MPPVDERPRSEISDRERSAGRPAGGRIPPLLWMVAAILVALLFVLVMKLAGPPTPGVGRGSADVVVPNAPPVRAP